MLPLCYTVDVVIKNKKHADADSCSFVATLLYFTAIITNESCAIPASHWQTSMLSCSYY